MVSRNTTAMHDVEYPPYSPSEVSELDDMERERERERERRSTPRIGLSVCPFCSFVLLKKLPRSLYWRERANGESHAKSILAPNRF